MLNMFAIMTKIQNEKKKKNEIQKQREALLNDIQQAQLAWHDAQAQYEEAVEIEQIEYAIYYLKASEKKYSYLLNQAKKNTTT